MEGNFRNVLIIISAVIIGAIFVHGLWTIRKNKNPYKLKASKHAVDPQERDFDRSGFDQDGVGQPRVVKSNQEVAQTSSVQTGAETLNEATVGDSAPTIEPQVVLKDTLQAAEHPSEQIDGHQNTSTVHEANLDIKTSESTSNASLKEPQEPSFGSLDFDLAATEPAPENEAVNQPLNDVEEANPFTIKEDEQVAEETAMRKARIEQPVYAEPVTHAKPAQKRESKAQALKRNQMEINFGDEAAAPKAPKSAPTVESEPIVLSVVVGENQIMSGAVLLPTLLTLGLKFGEMNIFHRHEDNAGNGKITFSIANMLNPGTFDLDSMETFVTQGVTLFMTLPNEGDPFEVYSQMLAAAKHLAQEFNGQVLDEKRSVMTKQTEQHYMSKIREFDRKSRIAAL